MREPKTERSKIAPETAETIERQAALYLAGAVVAPDYDIYQDYADQNGCTRAEAKTRMFRIIYGGGSERPSDESITRLVESTRVALQQLPKEPHA